MSSGRSKKRKLHHGQRGVDGSPALSHAQIWDDSALVESWNAALAEYEYYHSLAARGLDVERVVARAEASERDGRALDLMLDDDDDAAADAAGGGEVEEGEVEEAATADAAEEEVVKQGDANDARATATATEENATGTGPLNSNNNDQQLLENVKMAYYWAGYYSGLYDAAAQQKRAGPAS